MLITTMIVYKYFFFAQCVSRQMVVIGRCYRCRRRYISFGFVSIILNHSHTTTTKSQSPNRLFCDRISLGTFYV